MSLIKKIDVEKHFAARRAMRRDRIGQVSQRDTTGIEASGIAAKAPRFIENLALGHSSPGDSAASVTEASGLSEDSKSLGSRQL